MIRRTGAACLLVAVAALGVAGQQPVPKVAPKAAGWTPSDKGCIGDTEDKDSHGAVCLFKRKDGTKEEGLAIVLAQDEKTKQTEIFYVRIDLSQPTPSPSRIK